MIDKIFISHSSVDIDYVRLFVDNILKLGLDIPANRIFCSSIEGQGIRSGAYIPDTLKDEISKSSLALLFISENYKRSEICLNEVGAAWVSLPKENVIPILLPGIEFSKLGLLDINRIGIKLNERNDILKFIQDTKNLLNPNFDLQKLDKYILINLDLIDKLINTESEVQSEPELDSVKYNESDCYSNILFPFDEIIRKSIPALDEGIHKITDTRIQNQLLTDLSQSKFLNKFWYKYSKGDNYIDQLRKLPTGNWLFSKVNWEVKISEILVCSDSELQYEFILIRTVKLDSFKIASDVGGTSYNVGILNDGTIVSENEYNNGYAIINGDTINLDDYSIEHRCRMDKPHWFFFVSEYHKVGYSLNSDKIRDFCSKLDNGILAANKENISTLLSGLSNNPVVLMYR